MQRELNYVVDIGQRIIEQPLNEPLFTHEQNAHAIRVTLKRYGEDVQLSGAAECEAYILHEETQVSDRVEGSIEGNVVTVVIPPDTYLTPGFVRITLLVTEDEETLAVLRLTGTIKITRSSSIYDPSGQAIPDTDELIRRLQDIEEYVDDVEVFVDDVTAVLAPSFDPEDANGYSVGEFVIHNAKMYRCVAPHTGAWDSSHFEETTAADMLEAFDDEISDLKSHIVEQSEDPPTSPNNRIWFPSATPEGVDVPTFEEFSELKSAVDGINDAIGAETQTEITLTWYEGANGWDKRDKTGTPRQDTGYQAAYAVNVLPGEKYLLKNVYCNTNSNKRGYLVYKTDFSELLDSAPVQEAAGQYDFTVTIPENGGKLCINCCSSTGSISAATTLKKLTVEYIDGIQMSEDVTELKNTAEETTGKTYNLFVHNITAETTTNGVTITPIDNSTVSIVTGENGATANTYVWGGELPAGTYFMHTDGLLKNKITVRHGSGYSVWKNNKSITLTGAENVYIRVESGAVIGSAQTVRVTIVSGMYYKPYIEGGLSAVDHEARAEAKNATSVSIGDIIADNLDARKWIVPAKYKLRFGTTTADVLELLFFSDPHNDTNAVWRFLQFGGEVGCDMICAGDIVASYASSSSLNGWNGVPGVEDIMLVPGNHDWYANSQYTEYITQADMESRLFGNASGWGVTRPENASYWYKDYADQKVRLIGLDSWLVYVDQEAYGDMMTWLAETLAGANTAGYHVLIMNHTPPLTDNVTEIDCNFSEQITDYSCGITSGAMDAYAESQELPTIAGAVHDFTEAGGHFICYLFGHIHRDYVGKLVNYSDQMLVVIGTANAAIDNTNDVCRTGPGVDLIDYIAIDTNKTLCKIVRIGASKTALMVERDRICFDYSTGTIMS